MATCPETRSIRSGKRLSNFSTFSNKTGRVRRVAARHLSGDETRVEAPDFQSGKLDIQSSDNEGRGKNGFSPGLARRPVLKRNKLAENLPWSRD